MSVALLLASGLVAAAVPPTTPSAPAVAEAPARFAVIVANNRSVDGSLSPLRFADDDGARYAELLGLGDQPVTLLSVMDADTQALHPALAQRARVPSRAELDAALEASFAAVAEAKAAGRRTVFYFVYVGHGSVGEDGEGAVHLSDAHFKRSDLFQSVLARSPATINHVIIDACHAYLMVARRGGQASTEAALQSFLQKEGLEAYPNTGVLLSTSQAKEVHEWSRFSAGIFSHEVRSAMIGAADVDRDGGVTYAEARAFVSAANARVDNPMAKLEIFARAPPLHLAEPLMHPAWTDDAPQLAVPATTAGRWYLEDERGVRYADFHSAPGEALALTLVPQPKYFLRGGTRELEIPLAAHRWIEADQLEPRPIALAMRGSEAATFQRDLFALPFGRAYFEGYKAAAPKPVEDTKAWLPPAPEDAGRTRRYVAFGLGAAGVAALATGVGFALGAQSKADTFQTFIGDDDELQSIGGDARDYTTASRVLIGAGAGLVAGAVGLWLWPDD